MRGSRLVTHKVQPSSHQPSVLVCSDPQMQQAAFTYALPSCSPEPCSGRCDPTDDTRPSHLILRPKRAGSFFQVPAEAYFMAIAIQALTPA